MHFMSTRSKEVKRRRNLLYSYTSDIYNSLILQFIPDSRYTRYS